MFEFVFDGVTLAAFVALAWLLAAAPLVGLMEEAEGCYYFIAAVFAAVYSPPATASIISLYIKNTTNL